MATLSAKTFTTLVSDFAAAVQGAASQLIDFTIGSVLRADAEAVSGVGLWLQGLAYQILAAARLSTSEKEDVDSFLADFGEVRLPAIAATTLATFARFTPTLPAVIAVGARVATSDGTQPFLVYADPTNSAYDPTAANGAPGYTIAAGVSSAIIPVQAVNKGLQGNVRSGTITLIQGSGISGVDTVTNAAAVRNGMDAESDADAKRRFRYFILSLRAGTPGAIAYAIMSTRQGLQWTINENVDPDLVTVNLGFVSVFVDDGSGAIPADLLAAVSKNINDNVRAAGIREGTFAGETLLVNVSFTLDTAEGYDHGELIDQATDDVTEYVNGVGLGNKLPWSKIGDVAYDASPGITNVRSVLLNGGTVDIIPTKKQTPKVGAMVVS